MTAPSVPIRTKAHLAAAATRTPLDPPKLPTSMKALAKLTPEERDQLTEARVDYINQLGIIATPDVRELEKQIRNRRRLNRGHSGTATGIGIDGVTGAGKTQAALSICLDVYRDAMRPGQSWAAENYEHIPVVYALIAPEATDKMISQQILSFMGRPIGKRENRELLNEAVADMLDNCGTQLVVLDELTNVTGTKKGQSAANQIKAITERSRATFLYIGNGLRSSPAFTRIEGKQLRSRTRVIQFDYQSISTPDGRADWIGIIRAIEDGMPLIAHKPGSVAKKYDTYLYDRTQGRLRSLSELLRQAAFIAMDEGVEKITKDILDAIEIDIESEAAYRSRAKART